MIRCPLFTRRKVTIAARAAENGDGEGKTITGYAAVFYREDDPGTEYQLWDDEYERIMPGAFDRALREDDVLSFYNHDPNIVLGRRRPGQSDTTLRLSVDSTGLKYEADPPSSRADVLETIGRGDIDGSSFMFISRDTTFRQLKDDEDRTIYIREINDVQLWETGPVAFPAYESTTADLRDKYHAQVRAEREKWTAQQTRERIDPQTLAMIETNFRMAELGNAEFGIRNSE